MTLNQRLDQMGPQYRAICGGLHRAVTIIEDAAGSNPPSMSASRLETVIRIIINLAADLEQAQKAFSN